MCNPPCNALFSSEATGRVTRFFSSATAIAADADVQCSEAAFEETAPVETARAVVTAPTSAMAVVVIAAASLLRSYLASASSKDSPDKPSAVGELHFTRVVRAFTLPAYEQVNKQETVNIMRRQHATFRLHRWIE